jgi:hypothetical protein
MKRVQKKWGKELDVGVMYCGRPSPWGNPYSLDKYTREEALDLYRTWLQKQIQLIPLFLNPLRNSDLACWCKLSERCHVDILLEFLELGL